MCLPKIWKKKLMLVFENNNKTCNQKNIPNKKDALQMIKPVVNDLALKRFLLPLKTVFYILGY
jgi:hypothetical protein